jgi:hypothetical protein
MWIIEFRKIKAREFFNSKNQSSVPLVVLIAYSFNTATIYCQAISHGNYILDKPK